MKRGIVGGLGSAGLEGLKSPALVCFLATGLTAEQLCKQGITGLRHLYATVLDGDQSISNAALLKCLMGRSELDSSL
jgi:hypothetical protein